MSSLYWSPSVLHRDQTTGDEWSILAQPRASKAIAMTGEITTIMGKALAIGGVLPMSRPPVSQVAGKRGLP